LHSLIYLRELPKTKLEEKSANVANNAKTSGEINKRAANVQGEQHDQLWTFAWESLRATTKGTYCNIRGYYLYTKSLIH
jgi:hypothetical protein